MTDDRKNVVGMEAPIPDLFVTAPGHDGGDKRVLSAEAGPLWLWAFPELLSWQHDIAWLFSPVARNNVWRGSIWGVDERGDLLVLESKSARRGDAEDPYASFVGYESSLEAQACFLVAAIMGRWQELHAAEIAFVEQHKKILADDQVELGECPGLVPWSSERATMWRWRGLYREKIAPWVTSPDYERRVKVHLEARADRDDASTHYFGLITVPAGERATLSDEGREHRDELIHEVEEERVHLRGASSAHTGEQTLIEVWTPA